MRKVFLLAVVLAANAVAQEAKPDLKLAKVEVLEWENIQLKATQLNAEYKIDEYNQKMNLLKKQLADLNAAALSTRKVDAKEYDVSWQANPPSLTKKAVEAAKK